MDINKADIAIFEKLLKPVQDAIKNLPTKESLSNLPTKGDLSSELQELFESVTIFVNEELKKRDDQINILKKEFHEELKKRDDHIKSLGEKLDELASGGKFKKNFEIIDKSAEEVFPSRNDDEKEDLDLVLIGDSIIRNIDLDRINPEKSNKKFCKPGGKIEDAYDSLKEAHKNHRIKRLIFCTGTNHIPNDTPATVSEKLLRLVRTAKSNMPDTQIFVSAILPKSGKTFAKGINYVNRSINQASKFGKFDFIYNLQFQENGEQNFDLYANDGLHLNKRGIARLAMNFKYRLKKLS